VTSLRVNLYNLTQQEAAALCGVTSRSMRDWATCPRNDDGSYDGPKVVQWLVQRASGDGEYDNQRERLAAAQAEKVEAENALRRGEVAYVSDVQAVWVDHVSSAKKRILGAGAKLGPQLTNISDASVIAAAIRAELTSALAELADYDPVVRKPAGGDTSRGEGVDATA